MSYGRPDGRVPGADRIDRALFATVEKAAAHLPSLVIERVFIPPIRAGTGQHADFGWVRLNEGSVGFFYTWIDDVAERLLLDVAPEDLRGAGVMAFARDFLGRNPARRALALGILNAISQALFRAAGYIPEAGTDSLAGMEFGTGDRVGMVGLFPPLVERLSARGVDLVIIERKPELAARAAGCEFTLDPQALAGCNKILCTGTTLLNASLDVILGFAKNAERLAIIGPTASCIPDALFERGCDVIGGVRAVDPDHLEYLIKCGEPWGLTVAKYVISAKDYPGLEQLLVDAHGK